MGKIDREIRSYLSDKEIFADVVNHVVFAGRPEVSPQELQQLDSSELVVPYGPEGRIPIQRFRDVSKLWTAMRHEKSCYVVIGMEAQTGVHYAMPVRNMLMDGIQYAKQVEEVGRARKRDPGIKKNQSKEEFLSGFGKEDRILPVITIVVHFSPERWDGPLELYEMLDIGDDEIRRFVPNYKVNLLDPADMTESDLQSFHTDFGKVMEYIKYSEDKKRIAAYRADPRFADVDRQSARIANLVTGSQLRLRTNREGRVNMCKGIEELCEDIREETREETRREMCRGIAELCEDIREETRREMIEELRGRVREETRREMSIAIEGAKADARAEGRKEQALCSIRNLMTSMNLTVQQALQALMIPQELHAEYAAELQKLG